MLERLTRTMATVLGVEPGVISETTSPKTLASWDSLRHMSLILALEEAFEIEFDEAEMTDLTSFAALRDAIQRKLGNP